MWYCPCMWVSVIVTLYVHVTVSVIVTLSVHVTLFVIVTLPMYYVCDILPHSSGIPFRDLLDSTGWLCYSTLVPFPTFSKQTGDTVPTGPYRSCWQQPSALNGESVTASCKYPFTDGLTTLQVSVIKRTRDKW